MRFIGHILRIIILTTIIAFVGYNISDHFRVAIDQKIEWLFPCRSIITYSIDTVDPKFGITKDQFINMVHAGEKTWEDSAGKNLFDFKKEGGKVSINLIYDTRQASTDKLKKLGYVINNDKESYNTLKAKYDSLRSTLSSDRQSVENDINTLKADQDAFAKEVEYWNKRGGAPKDEYARLERQKDQLNKEADDLNARQAELNERVDTINSLGTVLNDLIYNLNLDVERYNDNQGTLGDEFDQGEYRLDENGRSINIYQFDNKEKLTRVLAHELGHALGIGHNDNPASLMYRINEGKTLKLSPEDISSLKETCKVL